MQEHPDCTTGTAKPNAFTVFWTNHTKVWTIKSTYIFSYTCEREVPTNMNDTGLQITTYFDTRNSFTLNWTFTENDTITCALSSSVELKRQILYQKETCAVFKIQVLWRSQNKTSDNTHVQGKTYYKLVVDDKDKDRNSTDCTKKYRKARGKEKNYNVYRKSCKQIENIYSK
uniref:Lipocalin n=1 Tax=Rhipicephalus zambeziensis TaxID=60191 RepID=A0A224YMI4_9ACAR